MQRQTWQIALLILIAFATLMINLGGPRLWDRDETRNAGCAREMRDRNDWVVPTFNEELRDAKPVLLYWLIMVSYGLFGVNEFAARLPSALMALGTVMATYVMARRLFNPQVALLAGVILTTSMMFEVAGHAATPDSALIFCSTLAMMVFVLATFRPRTGVTDKQRTAPQLRTAGRFFPTNWLAVSAMYAVMGVGILAKGPIGLILPTAVIGMFLLIIGLPDRESGRSTRPLGIIASCFRPFAPKHFFRTCLQMRLVTATLVAVAVAAPWFLWVGIRTNGDFLRGFFIDEHFGRATQAMEHHSGGPLFYLVALLVGFFPWSVFLIPTLCDGGGRIRRNDPWRIGYLLATCWVGVYITLFTLAATKLPSYVTPCYPGLAMLAGCFIYHVIHGTILVPVGWIRFGLVSLGTVGVACMIGLPIAAAIFLPGEHMLGVVGLIPLVGAVVCLSMWRRGKVWQMATAFSISAIVLMVAIFGVGVVIVDRHRYSFVLLEKVKQRGPDTQIGAFGGFEPSLVFYAGRHIQSVTDNTRSNKRKIPTIESFLSGNQDAVLITTGRYYDRIAQQLPEDIEILCTVPRFLKNDTLILLGQARETIPAVTKKPWPAKFQR
ncbi:MAG: glycosyltransferase family 39 protein [Planctomycetales bacterium]